MSVRERDMIWDELECTGGWREEQDSLRTHARKAQTMAEDTRTSVGSGIKK